MSDLTPAKAHRIIPRRNTLYVPWRCDTCKCIFESMDEPGMVEGLGPDGRPLTYTCRLCIQFLNDPLLGEL